MDFKSEHMDHNLGFALTFTTQGPLNIGFLRFF
jgi:hypothetical protein